MFNKGCIEQIGTPNEIYNHSDTEFVCNFIGDINRLSDEVVSEMIAHGADLSPANHNYTAWSAPCERSSQGRRHDL